MGVFGKRTAKQPAASAAFDQSRVFPKELWDDPKLGRMLESAGLYPDAVSNLVQTPEVVDRRLQQARDALEAERARAEAIVRHRTGIDVEVVPFYIYAESTWNGPHGGFLASGLLLTPHDEWNILFVLKDMRMSLKLGIAYCPPNEIPAFAKSNAEVIDRERRRHAEAYHESTRTRDYLLFQQVHESVIHAIKAHANGLRSYWTHHYRDGLEELLRQHGLH